MEIGGLQKSTLIDYPGKVACTVFLIGCNFKCPWCYSSEIVLSDKIAEHPRIDESEFFKFLDQRKKLLEGVVVCGGEPTIHKNLPEFVSLIKEKGFKVKLDTNGSNPEMIEKLIGENLVDYIAMDIKAPLENEKYREATGEEINVSQIKKSIELIQDSGVDYEFRTTVVPAFHSREDIEEIARGIAGARKYFLQRFRPEKNIDPFLIGSETYSEEFLEETKEKISHLFNVCEIRC